MASDYNLSLVVENDLILRSLKIEDAPTLFKLIDNNREYLRRFQNWLDLNQTEADSRNFINKEQQDFKAGKSLTLAIWCNQTLVGIVGFQNIIQTSYSASIGYWLDESHQGKGMMTKSVKALIEYGFMTLNLHRLEIRCAVHNKKSEQIPLALGFKKEGTLKEAEWHYDKYFDMNLFGLVCSEGIAKDELP